MTSKYEQAMLVIDGKALAGEAGAPVLDPSTGEQIGVVPHATQVHLQAAVDAAQRGFAAWRSTPPQKREQVMARAAELIRARSKDIGAIITREQGKPIAEAEIEVIRAAELVDWNAHEGRRTYGRVIPGPAGMRQMVLREPIGAVAGFSPWNSPASAPARKIGAALAAGCSIVLKAAEETPAGAYAFVRCFMEAGVPDGVVNLVFGNPAEISRFLIDSTVIRAITFTGSVPVGMHLARMAAGRMKPALMELGGHSPLIVCGDADPVQAARIAAAGKFRNAGQVCISPTRFIVDKSVYRAFADAFTEFARELKVGPGFEPGVKMGPVLRPRRVEAMEGLVSDAIARGASVAAGGKRRDGSGFFFEPTVLLDVPLGARVMNEEPFGPVAPVVPFQTLDEAIRIANSLPLGLAGYAFTDSAVSAGRLADELQVGHLSINHVGAGLPESPFGGVRESGQGREGGIEGLEGYLVTKFVSHRFRTDVPLSS
jgi:succinate-semialdehyde dehydrogenase/glutarate-semialdehyde dehydrogenase